MAETHRLPYLAAAAAGLVVAVMLSVHEVRRIRDPVMRKTSREISAMPPGGAEAQRDTAQMPIEVKRPRTPTAQQREESGKLFGAGREVSLGGVMRLSVPEGYYAEVFGDYACLVHLKSYEPDRGALVLFFSALGSIPPTGEPGRIGDIPVLWRFHRMEFRLNSWDDHIRQGRETYSLSTEIDFGSSECGAALSIYILGSERSVREFQAIATRYLSRPLPSGGV